MKKILSLLVVISILTSSLCATYFAVETTENSIPIVSTKNVSTPDEVTTTTSETTTSSNISTPDEPTTESSTEPTSESTTSSTEPTTTEPTDIKVTSINLNTDNYVMYSNQYLQLKAIVSPTNATNKNVTWSSNNTKIVTVDNDGKVKALKVGYAIITATSTDGSNVSAQCKIKVAQRVTKIKLNKSIINLSKKGKTAKLKATVYPTNAYNKSVTWKSNNTKVVTVDKNGKIKAIINKGITYVNAIAKDGSNKRARVLVIVGPKVQKITLNKSSVTLSRGAKNRTFQLKKSIKNKNATYKAVAWNTSNKNIATVNINGKVTIKRRGKVVITARAKDGSNKSAKCKITVKQLVTKLSYNGKKQAKEVYKNKTIKFAVAVAPSNANNKGLTYSSSNKKVATINSKGVIKGIKAGTVTITAKAKDRSNKVVKIKVKVKNPPITDTTILTEKTLKNPQTVKRICTKLNNYFKSCGATIEPRLKGQWQWYVEGTQGYPNPYYARNINEIYVSILNYWIQEMSGDFLNNNDDWNDKGYLKDSNKYADFLKSFDYVDKKGHPKYRKDLILDSKYNGFDWLINTYTKKTNKFLVYVDYEKMKLNGKDYKDKDGNQEYVIKFYYNWQSIEDYNNHKDPKD